MKHEIKMTNVLLYTNLHYFILLFSCNNNFMGKVGHASMIVNNFSLLK